METLNSESLKQVFEVLIAVVGVGGGVTAVTQAIKSKLDLKGGKAMALYSVVATVAAIVTMVVAGQITAESFALSNLALTIPLIHVGSQAFYKTFLEEGE